MSLNFKFDTRELQKEIEKKAGEAFLRAAENAKRSLGSDGQDVVIRCLSSPRREGTHLTFADLSFPSEDLKRRFEQALQRELR